MLGYDTPLETMLEKFLSFLLALVTCRVCTEKTFVLLLLSAKRTPVEDGDHDADERKLKQMVRQMNLCRVAARIGLASAEEPQLVLDTQHATVYTGRNNVLCQTSPQSRPEWLVLDLGQPRSL